MGSLLTQEGVWCMDGPGAGSRTLARTLEVEPPGTVVRGDLNVKEQQIDVWSERTEGAPPPCPEAAKKRSLPNLELDTVEGVGGDRKKEPLNLFEHGMTYALAQGLNS